MPSKSDYEKIFNKIFNTDIKWSKLSKEELAQLAAVLNNPPESLTKTVCANVNNTKDIIKNQLDDVIDTITSKARDVIQNWDGPLIKLAKKIIKEE